ncbi:MAG: hypothetical protein AB1601_04810 [Planctomycetota bacterium]
MSSVSFWIVVLVIVAVALALRASGARRRRTGLGAAVVLIVLAFGALVAIRSQARTTTRAVVVEGPPGRPGQPGAVVELSNGRLVIRNEALRTWLPPEVPMPPRPPRLPSAGAEPPAPATQASATEDTTEDVAAAIRKYFDELITKDRGSLKAERAELRSLLARLKVSERRRLADELARWTYARGRDELTPGPEELSLGDQFLELQLEGGPDQWRRFVTSRDVRAATVQAPPLVIRLILLFGTIVVAAAVLRRVVPCSTRAGHPHRGN